MFRLYPVIQVVCQKLILEMAGISGYLSDVGEIDAMAENALKIIRDEKTLQEFKAEALETAKQFDIQNILPLYEELYLRAISIYA